MTWTDSDLAAALPLGHGAFPYPGEWLSAPFPRDLRGRAVVAADRPGGVVLTQLVVEPDTGRVLLADLESGDGGEETVATSPEVLRRLVAAAHRALRIAGDPRRTAEAAANLRAVLQEHDSGLVDDDESFWSVTLEEIGYGLLGDSGDAGQ